MLTDASSIASHGVTLAFLAMLAVSFVSLWWPADRRVWASLFVATLALAMLAALVTVMGLVLLGVAALLLYGLDRLGSSVSPSPWRFAKHPAMQPLLLGAFVVMAAGLSIGWLPGFEKIVWHEAVRISPDAVPYTFSLNVAKAALGMLVLGLSVAVIRDRRGWLAIVRPTLLTALTTIIVVAILALVLGQVRLDAKFPALIGVWAVLNFATCVAEEALCRGLLQQRLALWWRSYRSGQYLAWLIASFSFGLAHMPGGANAFWLASVAGLGYGWVYLRTGKIESAVVVHFLVNTSHVLLLTYPNLERAG